MRSSLVTGAYGFIGSALVRGLLQRGVGVTVLRRDATPRSTLLIENLEARVNVVTGDATDSSLVERALADYEVDTVFHLAAQTIVGTARRSPLTTWEVNVGGTWTMLEACRRLGVQRVIVAASDKAYGDSDDLPYREDTALQPRYPYETSKAAADLIARSYWPTLGVPVATTRFANVYGGGDLHRSRLIPEVVDAVLAGRRPIIRSDGTPERDLLFVDDAVAAYLAVADALDGEGARGEAFNAGCGRSYAVREVAELICRIAGSDVEPDIQGQAIPYREIDRQYVDSSKLHGLTGWQPRVSLEEGLRRTVDWYRANPGVLGD
jgi:CDP-glucose 4,6-dehydratase